MDKSRLIFTILGIGLILFSYLHDKAEKAKEQKHIVKTFCVGAEGKFIDNPDGTYDCKF